MRLRLDLIPAEIIQRYKLHDFVDDQGWVYVEIRMGMYGLPQAGILANKLLEQRLNTKGYYHCQHTPGLWRHVWRDITFCLVVDDFGIKSTSRDHVIHLKEHHQTCHVFRLRIRTCRSLLWLQTSCSHPHHTRRNGPSTTQTHHGNHRQHHRPRAHHGHNDPQSIQVYGPTFPVAKMPYLWRHGIHNRADYNSKHHPTKHHQAVRPFYIQDTLPRQ